MTLVLLSASCLLAEDLPAEQERLISVAKLWTTVQYFHPYLAYRNIDWDRALVEALPAIRTAASPDEYATALNKLLGQLHDSHSFAEGPLRAKKAGTDFRKNEAAGTTAERIRVHYGPASAFLTRPAGEVEDVVLPMGGGVTATVRLSEPVTASVPQIPTAEPERPYTEMACPAVEYRILSAFKVWGAVKNFFAYKDLMDQDWDQAFVEFLPKFMAANNARDYNLAIAEAVTLLDDSNAKVSSANLDEYFGIAPVGLRTRLVEKKPLVTEVLDEEAKRAGIQPGDVIAKVDGEDVVARIHRFIAYIPASTDQALAADVIKRVSNGPEGSTASLTLQSKAGGEKTVTLKRSSKYSQALAVQRTGEVTRYLSRAIGYVDLDRLQVNQIDSVLEKFQGTTALVLDMRGTLHFDPSLISSRVLERRDAAMAIVTGPISFQPDLPSDRNLTQTASFFRVETLPPSEKAHYKGRTVMLIDERTIGSGERLGLQLEAANKTIFVGTLSAGAEGEVTTVVLPGAVSVSFSSTDVRHGNGGKLQRVGLQPAETAPTTVKAIREGRDEVLDKALDAVAR